MIVFSPAAMAEAYVGTAATGINSGSRNSTSVHSTHARSLVVSGNDVSDMDENGAGMMRAR